MPFVSYSNGAHLHTLARRDTDNGTLIPVVVVVGIVLIIIVITWIRVVKARERKLWPNRSYMAAANPVGRVRRYEPEQPEPRRPRTPPALRPRNENTYVRRPEAARWKRNHTADSVQPTPPLYRSEVPTPERGASSVNVPILEMPVIPQDITTSPALDLPAPTLAIPTSVQDPPPPYNQ